VLNGGDVYQLCFTADPGKAMAIDEMAARHGISVTRIGRVLSGAGLRVLNSPIPLRETDYSGFDHFG